MEDDDMNSPGCSYFKHRGETRGEQLEWARKVGASLLPPDTPCPPLNLKGFKIDES